MIARILAASRNTFVADKNETLYDPAPADPSAFRHNGNTCIHRNELLV